MRRSVRFFATTAIASVLVATTGVPSNTSFPVPFGVDEAYAGKGGNGGGRGAERGGRGGGRDAEMNRGGEIGDPSGHWKRGGGKKASADKRDKNLLDTKAGRMAKRGAENARGLFGRMADTVKDKVSGRDKERVAKAPKSVPNARPESHGATASKLGALNAAHASDKAFENASPNSRVGRIAAYLDAMKATGQYNESLANLEGMDEVTQEDVDAAAAVVASLEEDMAQLPVDDPARADLETELAEAKATLKDVETAFDEYQDAASTVAELEDAAADDPRDLLEAAANKPVDDDVKAAVDAILGLDTFEDPVGAEGTVEVGQESL